MLNIFGNDAMRIKKCLLSKRKGNVVLCLVFTGPSHRPIQSELFSLGIPYHRLFFMAILKYGYMYGDMSGEVCCMFKVNIPIIAS